MGKVVSIISGIGLLIGIFLVLNNGKATASIIDSLGTTGTRLTKTLQGR